jgi:hypothetical protein
VANLKGIVSLVSELRVERTNLVSQLKHVDAALSVLGKLNGGSSYTKPRRFLSVAARRKMSLAQKARGDQEEHLWLLANFITVTEWPDKSWIAGPELLSRPAEIQKQPRNAAGGLR